MADEANTNGKTLKGNGKRRKYEGNNDQKKEDEEEETKRNEPVLWHDEEWKAVSQISWAPTTTARGKRGKKIRNVPWKKKPRNLFFCVAGLILFLCRPALDGYICIYKYTCNPHGTRHTRRGRRRNGGEKRKPKRTTKKGTRKLQQQKISQPKKRGPVASNDELIEEPA